MALQCGAELHLLYACDISALYMTDMGGLAVTDLMEDLQSTEKDRFFELAQRCGVPRIVTTSSWAVPSRH
jgi:universal stress protein E